MLKNQGFWVFSEKSRFSEHVATWILLLLTSNFFGCKANLLPWCRHREPPTDSILRVTKKCNPFLLNSTNPFLKPEQPSCEQFRFFNANASAKTTVRSFCRKLWNSIFGAKNVQAYKFKFCKLNKFTKHYPVYFPRKSKAFCAWTSPSGPPSVFEKYLIDQPFCTFWGCENRVWCLINLFCL